MNPIEVRKDLHQLAELSNKEEKTSEYVKSFLSENCPSAKVISVADTGVLAFFEGEHPSKQMLFRCELDALPIPESNEFDYKSKNPKTGHKCGHDGHMTIMLTFALALEKDKPDHKIYLLFQPSEETGEGAQRVLNDRSFKKIGKLNHCIALHNVPGYPKKEIVLKSEVTTASVISLEIEITGKQSHAAEPWNGSNPAIFIADLINESKSLERQKPGSKKFSLVTPVYLNFGDKNYGIINEKAMIGFTLRTATNRKMNKLKKKLNTLISDLEQLNNVECKLEWKEEFPAVFSDPDLMQKVVQICEENKFNHRILEHPFPWGEDFGFFTIENKGLLFGLGSGEDHVHLHHPEYDFPDEIIDRGVDMFLKLSKTDLS